MRRVLTERITTIWDASQQLGVSHTVGAELAASLKQKAHLEYLGAIGRDYRVRLTELGHQTTTQRMSSGRHVASMPISLKLYHRVVEAQQSTVHPDRATMRAAFADLVVGDHVLDQIGPAFIGEGAMFLYGPAGTGKTSLAERMNRIATDAVLIPHFVEVDGQVISVFDPSLHRPVLDAPASVDQRWVLCHRPLVTVGGELDLSMLDLRFDRISGLSTAPIQMASNNGILVVDDFGRQAVRPEELLNRWIVPLTQGIDYLKSSTGAKFTVPFEVKLVISTNLDPNSLGDDAFLRRLPNKVFIGPVDDHAFDQIFDRAAADHGVKASDEALSHLREVTRTQIGELRPYVAVDFCRLTTAVCQYEKTANVLDPEVVDRVAALYFVQSEAEAMSERALNVWDQGLATPKADQHGGYEIGALFHDDPLAGLEALAKTLSVDGAWSVEGVPYALRPHGKG